MRFVTVFRRVPRPITGMIGILQDPDFERFEANLDWLETTGWDKASTPPALPDDVVAKTREKYIQAYEMLVYREFPWKRHAPLPDLR